MTTSRGLLRDYEHSCGPSFEALVQNECEKPVGGVSRSWRWPCWAPYKYYYRPTCSTPAACTNTSVTLNPGLRSQNGICTGYVISLIGWHLQLCTPASGQELFWHRHPNFKVDTTLAKILNICFMCYDPAALQGRNYLHPVAVKRTTLNCCKSLLRVSCRNYFIP